MPENLGKKIVIEVNSTRNADGGFPKGYQSRFWTYVRTLCEFGLVYVAYNDYFKISKIGKLLVNGDIDEQITFSTQAAIYNRKSPFRNVSNDFNYFFFIFKVLKELWKIGEKLSYEQFIVSLFSKEGNVEQFMQIIKDNSFSDNILTYEFLRKNYNITTKIDTVTKDYPDVVLRLLRITGFISVQYIGKIYIQLNFENLDYIEKLFQFSFGFSNEEKENRKSFFEKYETYSSIIINDKSIKYLDDRTSYSEKLKQIIIDHSINDERIENLLNNLIKGISEKGIKDEFKYIAEPIRLEFYLTILLQLFYGDSFIIKPNYKSDSYGLPISQAPGGKGDIEVFSDSIYWLIEVTLIRNKLQQINNETSNVIRHMQDTNKDSYLSFVAPKIHEDTQNYYDSQILLFLINRKKRVNVKPYDISGFTYSVRNKQVFEDMIMYTNNVIQKAKLVLKDDNII